jgi:hypothetical protein
MLFDLTGKRKHVVRVVYAILALLMGASLFLVIGPFNLANVINTGNSVSTSTALDEHAERIEQQLRKDPTDEALLLALTRTRINAGITLSVDPETGEQAATPEGQAEFEQGLQAWGKYVKHSAGDPNPVLAQLAAETYFRRAEYLAESSNEISEIERAIENAAVAQRLAVQSKRDANSLSVLAFYEYFVGNFSEGDKVAKTAVKLSGSPQAKKQLESYRKNAKAWQKQKKEFAKAEREQGKEALQNPLGGLGGSSSGTGLTP